MKKLSPAEKEKRLKKRQELLKLAQALELEEVETKGIEDVDTAEPETEEDFEVIDLEYDFK